jgi:hypothetical protein
MRKDIKIEKEIERVALSSYLLAQIRMQTLLVRENKLECWHLFKE